LIISEVTLNVQIKQYVDCIALSKLIGAIHSTVQPILCQFMSSGVQGCTFQVCISFLEYNDIRWQHEDQ